MPSESNSHKARISLTQKQLYLSEIFPTHNLQLYGVKERQTGISQLGLQFSVSQVEMQPLCQLCVADNMGWGKFFFNAQNSSSQKNRILKHGFWSWLAWQLATLERLFLQPWILKHGFWSWLAWQLATLERLFLQPWILEHGFWSWLAWQLATLERLFLQPWIFWRHYYLLVLSMDQCRSQEVWYNLWSN